MWAESHDMSFSTISSRDSGVSTMSTKEEFRSQPAKSIQQSVTQATARAQVTSAPNLRSRAFFGENKMAACSSANVEFKNGSLNIKLGRSDFAEVSDKIVLKVEHSSSNSFSTREKDSIKPSDGWDSSTITSRGSVYMNVPGHNSQGHGNAAEGEHGEPVQIHQYINVDPDLVSRKRSKF